MFSLYKKEINSFFSSLIGYIVAGVFLVFMGMLMWLFSDTSILESNYATIDQLFSLAPMIFIFLVPAVTMKSFADEFKDGTYELLAVYPIQEWKIVLAKFLANSTLLVIILIPTLIYVYSVYQLGSPKGNLDIGATIGSYFGLILLALVFVSIGLFSSAITSNQIVAFALGSFLCFFILWAFQFVSTLPIFYGKVDDLVQKLGINYHYSSMSRGVIDSRDIIYFVSVITLLLFSCMAVLEKRKG